MQAPYGSGILAGMSVAGPDTDEPAGEEAGEVTGSDDASETSEKEIGGRPGPDPTRYGDWEKAGRCIDF